MSDIDQDAETVRAGFAFRDTTTTQQHQKWVNANAALDRILAEVERTKGYDEVLEYVSEYPRVAEMQEQVESKDARITDLEQRLHRIAVAAEQADGDPLLTAAQARIAELSDDKRALQDSYDKHVAELEEKADFLHQLRRVLDYRVRWETHAQKNHDEVERLKRSADGWERTALLSEQNKADLQAEVERLRAELGNYIHEVVELRERIDQ